MGIMQRDAKCGNSELPKPSMHRMSMKFGLVHTESRGKTKYVERIDCPGRIRVKHETSNDGRVTAQNQTDGNPYW
jgi:hypothetical protein